MREAERVVNWILILFQWLIAMPNRAVRVLNNGWTFVAGTVGAERAAARRGWRRFERGSPTTTTTTTATMSTWCPTWRPTWRPRELPLLRSIGWMTYCLGQGWAGAPPGLSPAPASRALTSWTLGLLSLAMGWDVRRLVLCRAPVFIDDDRFLSRSGRLRGFTSPAPGALGHSTDFSISAYAADL